MTRKRHLKLFAKTYRLRVVLLSEHFLNMASAAISPHLESWKSFKAEFAIFRFLTAFEKYISNYRQSYQKRNATRGAIIWRQIEVDFVQCYRASEVC